MRDIYDLFNALNETNYLILRNYDDIISRWKEKNDDIDILCDDRDSLIAKIGAIPCRNNGICHNYYVHVGGRKVRIDIRSVGDGYYDKNWEKDMLLHRVWNGNFYVMNNDDFINSIAYHALIQKKEFSEKYFNIIRKEYDVRNKSILKCGLKMTKFMKKHNYRFVVPDDTFVALNKRNYRFFSIMYLLIKD